MILLDITSNPQSFAGGTRPAADVAMNGATWRFAFTFTSSSASGLYAGYHALFTAPSGDNSGGLWIATNTLEFYNLADQLLTSQALTWSAGATLTLLFDMVAKTITISGVTSGNGVISWSGSGPYFNGADVLTAGGLVGETIYGISGTFGPVDNGISGVTIDSGAVLLSASPVLSTVAAPITSAGVLLFASAIGERLIHRLALDSAGIVVAAAEIVGRTATRITIDSAGVVLSAASLGGRIIYGDALTAMENAIYAWVLAGSGLAASQVIWGRHSARNSPQPSGTFISMRITGTNRVSSDVLRMREVAGVIEHYVEGPRQPTLELTCFAGDAYGAGQAHNVLDRVLAAIRWPSVADALREGRVAVGRRGPIRVVDGARSTMFDPRAIVEIGLHTAVSFVDPAPGASIERVEAANGVTGGVVIAP